jgi:hypothetical protein
MEGAPLVMMPALGHSVIARSPTGCNNWCDRYPCSRQRRANTARADTARNQTSKTRTNRLHAAGQARSD